MKRFKEFLKNQSESCLWDSKGDGRHNGVFYQNNAASGFFPVAARELVKEGLDAENIALFCIEGAMEPLLTSGLSREEAENKLLKIVFQNRITKEVSKKAA